MRERPNVLLISLDTLNAAAVEPEDVEPWAADSESDDDAEDGSRAPEVQSQEESHVS